MRCLFFINASHVPPKDFQVDSLRKRCSSVISYVFFAPRGAAVPEASDCMASTAEAPSDALLEACAFAAEQRAHLVYLGAPMAVSDALLAALHAGLSKDHLFGMASPRFADARTDLTWSLPCKERTAAPVLNRRALAALPEQWIVPEFLSACLFIRDRIAANPPTMAPYELLEGALMHLLCKARRRSFRMLVRNRAVLRCGLEADRLYPSLSHADLDNFSRVCLASFDYPIPEGEGAEHFQEKYPPKDPAGEWYEDHPMHHLERLCAAAWPARGDRRRICVDCRGMMAFFCGTTVSQLGFLKGLEVYADDWDIHVLAQDFALKAHNLRQRFPRLHFAEPPASGYPTPEGEYAAIIHMNQPCYIGILRDLHSHGFVIACNILDTISWDMILGCPPEAERAWTFAAEHMDCIFYNSAFSQGQFNRRFPVRDGIIQVPTWHSFTLDENTQAEFRALPPGDYILVFGNNYDHKDVLLTTRRLREMFPAIRIFAFGPEQQDAGNTVFLKSGSLPDEEIESLMAKAALVVFPSWVEGFGLPVVKGLAYGRPVLVRSMPLWKEIASHCNLPGTLMEFDDAPSLVRVVSAVLQGQSCNVIEQGAGEKVMDWRACAGNMLEGITARLDQADSHAWLKRDRVFRLLGKE
jgi:glycosyltransferase involved in cell wall biosynthesis